MGERPVQPQELPRDSQGARPSPAPQAKPGERKVPAAEAPPQRTASGRFAGQASQTRSTRRISGRTTEPERRSRRLSAVKKKRDVVPILVIGALVLAVVGAVLGYFYHRQRLTRAVASGGELAFEALYAVAESGPSAVETLCRIVESGGPGRMAAAGALALIARQHGAEAVVPKIRARLKPNLSVDARAAYAAALAQGRSASSEEAAAALLSDPNESVRLSVIRGLAYGRSPAAAQAVGRALADPSDLVRMAAESAISEMVRTAPERAIEAASLALTLGERAQGPASRALAAVARKAQPEQVLPLLSSTSADVRAVGISALQDSIIASGNRAQAALEAIAQLIDSREEPALVKTAALDAAIALGISQAGPAALRLLRESGDEEICSRAAVLVGVARPEGAFDALLAMILREDTSRELRASCLEALARVGRAPADKLVTATRPLIELAEGKDELLAGLALVALKSISGLSEAKYGPSQWRTWLSRRSFELEALARARAAFEALKKAHQAKPDVERTRKAVNELGVKLQAVRDGAEAQDREPFDDLIREMAAFNRSIIIQRK